jgi:hypothetical protein
MPLDQIVSDLLPEMAYSEKKAEVIITGLEYPLNNHLLKLLAVPSDERLHWKNEVLAWLTQIAAIRLKPANKPGSAQFYFNILFEEPFGGVEIANVAARLELLRLQYGRLAPEARPEELARRLRDFHAAFTDACAAASMTAARIADLVDRCFGA